MGIKKNYRWTDELAEELHKPVTRKFKKRRVYAGGVDEIWTADLVDMKSFEKFNKGVKYLLTVIDVFSKYGWIVPLKNKTGVEVANALKQILKERKPDKLWVDKGKEFYNRDVQSLIDLYSTENEEKSSVVERWNRTMKEKMFKYFSANSTRKYIHVLDEMVKNYNETVHSSTKMTPIEASKKENENTVWRNLYSIPMSGQEPKFSVGDKVRITKKKKTFEKGYTPRWTEEVFSIDEVQYTNPPTYKLKDWNDEKVIGSFYEPELQKTSQDIFRIEKVLRKRGNKSLVKWLGYPESFNSWIDSKNITDL